MGNYQIRDACFICSSPYQVIGAIGIVRSKKLDADLYITPGQFPNYEDLVKRLRESGVFSGVYVASIEGGREKRDMLSRKIRSVKMTLFAEASLSAFLPRDVSYRSFYASSRSTLKAAMLAVLRKRDPEIRRIVFEDGLGSYSDDGRLMEASPLRRVIERVLGWDLDDHKKMSIMVYLPELLTRNDAVKDIPIAQMPRLEMNEENRRILSNIFSLKDTDCIQEKYIIFDTKRNSGISAHLSSEEKARLDEYYNIIRQYLGDSVVLKPHPRSAEASRCSLKTYPNQGVPMEVLYFSMTDLSQRVLISQVSTAIFSCKVFFDCEPTIICLHKLLKENELSKEFVSIYERFRKTYRDQERVMAPESVDELIEILKKIQGENEQIAG